VIRVVPAVAGLTTEAARRIKSMSRFEPVANVGDVDDGELARFEIGGSPITIANVGGSFYGFHDVCTHMGCSLAAGVLDETVVTCPCHGSQFDVTTGSVQRGPASDPVSTFTVRVEGETIEVEV
jgi:nitrite reductase/ring-hydroxylating ferredoxin subunit